mmetsp:Transcript_104645/g.296130  ORF Transcript_104645/g.296130 Transcript_104645/m.296130 type:complete len:227 (-) Transcript_104645:710-1390(-)
MRATMLAASVFDFVRRASMSWNLRAWLPKSWEGRTFGPADSAAADSRAEKAHFILVSWSCWFAACRSAPERRDSSRAICPAWTSARRFSEAMPAASLFSLSWRFVTASWSRISFCVDSSFLSTLFDSPSDAETRLWNRIHRSMRWLLLSASCFCSCLMAVAVSSAWALSGAMSLLTVFRWSAFVCTLWFVSFRCAPTSDTCLATSWRSFCSLRCCTSWAWMKASRS